MEGKSRENGNIGNLSKGLKSSAKEGITTERVHIGGNLFVVVWYGEFVAGTKPFMFHHW